jgi:hypothetical protein
MLTPEVRGLAQAAKGLGCLAQLPCLLEARARTLQSAAASASRFPVQEVVGTFGAIAKDDAGDMIAGRSGARGATAAGPNRTPTVAPVRVP